MSYESALRAAGAAVLAFEMFGSYQGDWLALCYYDGEFRWVHGSFGSCSACDAFDGEFDGWREDEDPVAYTQRLADFGKVYLDDYIEDVDEFKSRMRGRSGWDSEAARMVEYIERFPLTEEGKNKLTTSLLKETDNAD